MNANFKIPHFLLLVLVANLAAAQSNFVHRISANAGVSFPTGAFANDSHGEGHGFANPGLAAQLFYSAGMDKSRLSYLVGFRAMVNPLDEKNLLALWPEGVAMEAAKRYNVFGISGGVAFDLAKSELVVWQLRATLGAATISYPAHEMRIVTGSGRSRLVYRSFADNSINLNGSLASAIQCKVSTKVQLEGQMDFFRSRANHHITYISDGFPPSYEQNVRQQIAMVSIKIGISCLI